MYNFSNSSHLHALFQGVTVAKTVRYTVANVAADPVKMVGLVLHLGTLTLVHVWVSCDEHCRYDQ